LIKNFIKQQKMNPKERTVFAKSGLVPNITVRHVDLDDPVFEVRFKFVTQKPKIQGVMRKERLGGVAFDSGFDSGFF
jgi:hypothetical protein